MGKHQKPQDHTVQSEEPHCVIKFKTEGSNCRLLFEDIKHENFTQAATPFLQLAASPPESQTTAGNFSRMCLIQKKKKSLVVPTDKKIQQLGNN